MPSHDEAMRFALDPATSVDQLRQACRILGLPPDGDGEAVRARLLQHLGRVEEASPVVCLNPKLAAGAGRDAATRAAVDRFNDAFNRHDVDAIMAAMTGDCVFENTRPAPDGTRVEGAAAVRETWVAFFARSPHARFETEEMFVAGDRAVVRWIYRWTRDGVPGHVRGVDVFRVRDGKVAEKLSYVKG